MLVYKQYDQAALDGQYNNRLHVPDFATYLERWKLLSSQTEKTYHIIKDLPYGLLDREQMDIYPSFRPSSKTLIFIHGGYWYKLGKEYFQFIAEAFHGYGVTTILINHPLAPAVPMDQIVASCRRALCWVAKNISAFNGDPDQVYIAGYSAGGHLAAMLMTTDWTLYNLSAGFIKGVCTVSGLFNLIPVVLSDINLVLGMDEDTAVRNSPVHLMPARQCELAMFVGGNETDEFLDQSMELFAGWKENISARLIRIQGLNHYSIVETMLDPESILHQGMLGLMKVLSPKERRL